VHSSCDLGRHPIPRPWGCIPIRVLTVIWMRLGEALDWLDVIGTNQCRLGSLGGDDGVNPEETRWGMTNVT